MGVKAPGSSVTNPPSVEGPRLSVFVDTNALHNNLRLQGTPLHVLLLGSRLGLYSVHLSEVVLQELLRHARARLGELIDRASVATKELRRVTGSAYSLKGPDLESACTQYEASLRARLSSSRIVVHSVPTTPFGEYMKRELAGDKPYKAASGEGYRDDAIFETLISLLHSNSGALFFVTNNSIDFADPSDRTVMHRHLAARLRAVGHDPNRVVLVPTFEVLLKEHLAPRMTRNERYLEATKQKQWGSWIQEQLACFATDLMDGAVVPPPVDFSAAAFRAVPTLKEVQTVVVREAWTLPGEEVLLEIEATVMLSVRMEPLGNPQADRPWDAIVAVLSHLLPHDLPASLHALLVLDSNGALTSVSRFDLATNTEPGR